MVNALSTCTNYFEFNLNMIFEIVKGNNDNSNGVYIAIQIIANIVNTQFEYFEQTGNKNSFLLCQN